MKTLDDTTHFFPVAVALLQLLKMPNIPGLAVLKLGVEL